MLKRNIRLIHGQDSQQVLEVQYAEITHFKDNFTLMATVSALLAGFVFMVFGLEAEVLYKDVHVGQAQHREDSEIESCAREFLPPALGPRDSPRRLRTTTQ